MIYDIHCLSSISSQFLRVITSDKMNIMRRYYLPAFSSISWYWITPHEDRCSSDEPSLFHSSNEMRWSLQIVWWMSEWEDVQSGCIRCVSLSFSLSFLLSIRYVGISGLANFVPYRPLCWLTEAGPYLSVDSLFTTTDMAAKPFSIDPITSVFWSFNVFFLVYALLALLSLSKLSLSLLLCIRCFPALWCFNFQFSFFINDLSQSSPSPVCRSYIKL